MTDPPSKPGGFEVTDWVGKNFVTDDGRRGTLFLLRKPSIDAGYNWENYALNEFTDSKWTGELPLKR